jgi:hypothetical protein
MKRRIAMLLMAIMVALSVVALPAFADGYYPPPEPVKKKCNAGNGNGNEGCDPGNSAPQNKGGDEVVTPPFNSLPNPGGNNV